MKYAVGQSHTPKQLSPVISRVTAAFTPNTEVVEEFTSHRADDAELQLTRLMSVCVCVCVCVCV